jgi:hypothetical protein
MAKPKRKPKKKGHGHGPKPPSPEAIIDDLKAKAAEIASADPAAAGPLWGAAHKLLIKTDADTHEVMTLIASRDVEGLEQLVRRLAGGTVEPAAEDHAEASGPEIPAEVLKQAMRAFRKRVKLTRLDHESKLGVGPMTGGKKADFDAIMAPNDFDREVWETLVAQGKLKAMGTGFYSLVDDDGGG